MHLSESHQIVVQGGDWGSYVCSLQQSCIPPLTEEAQITRTIAGRHGSGKVKAWHTNYAASVQTHHAPSPLLMSHRSVVDPPSLWKFPRLWLQHLLMPYSDADRACLERMNLFMSEGRGYSAEQGTQPQTIGYALADSPVGLLAWIYEKLVRWSDDYPLNDDEGACIPFYPGPTVHADVMDSADLGLDLLVLEGGPCGVRADILRGGETWGEPEPRRAVVCGAGRGVALPQGTHSPAQNVRVYTSSIFPICRR